MCIISCFLNPLISEHEKRHLMLKVSFLTANSWGSLLSLAIYKTLFFLKKQNWLWNQRWLQKRNIFYKYQCSRVTTRTRCFQRHVSEKMVKSKELRRQKCEKSLSFIKKTQECRNFPKLQLPNSALALSEIFCQGHSGKLKPLKCHRLLFGALRQEEMEVCGSIKTAMFGGKLWKSLCLLQWQTNFILSIL